MRQPIVFAASILAIVYGCSSDSPAFHDPITSAGTETLNLLVDIPSTNTDGSISFGFAFDAAYLENGSIVIADYAGGALLFFDGSGRLLRKIGREGLGPGEFTSLNWVETCGDTIVTMDWRSTKMIGPDGTIAREVEVPPRRLEVACTTSMLFAGIDGPITRRPMMDTTERLTSRGWIADRKMTIVQELGDVPFGENRPLGKRTRIAIDSSHVYLGVPDSSAIDVYNYSGAKLGTLQLHEKLRQPTAEHYDAAIEEHIAYGTDAAMAEDFRRQLHSVPMPLTLPPYSGIFSERDGIVWAVLSSPGDEATRLRAVGADGALLGDVSIPADLRVFDVGPSFVIGRIDDAVSGEQRIAVYRKRPL